MALTAGDEHIRHTLGRSMSSEISHLDVVNSAGRWVTTVFMWRWLARRFATADLESGNGFVRLPDDFQSLGDIRHTASLTPVVMTGASEIHDFRVVGSTTYPWRAALTWRTRPVPNLVKHSSALAQSDWTFSTGTGTATANAAVDPYTNTNVADNLETTDTSAVAELTQVVYPKDLTDGETYTWNVVMRPDPVTATTPPKSAILLETPSYASSGLRSLLEIQWGQTPWQDAPTATIIDTSGGGTSMTPKPVGEGYWHFAIEGHTHQHEENYGRLLAGIQPARAAWADASATEDVAQIGSVDVARVWMNPGPLSTTYEETGATITVPRASEPVLEIAPIPNASSAGALSIRYRGGWVDATDDGDELTLPDGGWMDNLYTQALRAFARGWEEEGGGLLDQRLAVLREGPIFQAAIDTDGLMQPSYGQIKNTAMGLARRNRRWNGNVVGPITAGPTSA